MATRTIVTSQPDVACDVCGRRLLRGEQPDVFLAAGRRRTVCELCAPRAAHEGWTRERDSESVSLPQLRPRRGRSFIERLRQVGRPPGEGADPVAAVAREDVDVAPAPAFLAGDPHDAHGSSVLDQAPAGEPPSYVERAIEVFNASELPRRVAGVARSLGAPEVSVRSAEHLSSVVRIVVAWELCWYRYEVDLSEEPVEARVLAQGTELSELAHEERVANAVVGESGTLSPSAV